MNEQPKGLRMDDLYRQVTARIVKSLEEGTPVWVRPWDATSCLPANAITSRPYSGVNTLILWAEQLDKGYQSPRWLTFKQAQAAKASIAKGAKSVPVVYIDFKEKEQDDGTTKKVPVYRYFRVFNVEHTTNLRDTFRTSPPLYSEDERYDAALKFVNDCGVRVEYGGTRACYMPNRDVIQMPPYQSFTDDAAFFSVLFHEFVHSTGHKDRLNRNLGKRFGEEAYAAEELLAELGAAFLSNHFGYEAKGTEAYLDHYLKILKADHTAIFTVASQASRATDYLLESVYAEQENTPQVERSTERELDDAIPF